MNYLDPDYFYLATGTIDGDDGDDHDFDDNNGDDDNDDGDDDICAVE